MKCIVSNKLSNPLLKRVPNLFCRKKGTGGFSINSYVAMTFGGFLVFPINQDWALYLVTNK